VQHAKFNAENDSNSPLHLVLSEINALSLYCAQRTLHLNHLQGDVIASNGLTNVEGKFAHIITNPPFHTGVNTDYSIAYGFLAQAREHLIEQGSLVLVANSFLNYADVMLEHVGPSRKLGGNNRFSVYQAIAARAPKVQKK